VCPLIQDGAIPTGESGELQWQFVIVATCVTVSVIFVSHRWVVPFLLCQVFCSIWKLTAKTTMVILATTNTRRYTHNPQFSSVESKPSPTRSIMQFLAQQNWMRDSSPAHEREE
jgi:hypothetical protein